MPSTRPLRRHSRHGRRIAARGLAALVALGALAVLLLPGGAGAQSNSNVYQQTNLISDIAGVARITDPNLVNPWGMAASPTSPLWIADNGADVSTLYTGGVNGSIPNIVPLVVSIPGGAPTGIVFNSTSGFPVDQGGTTGPSTFIFDSEAGVISAWMRTDPLQTQAVQILATPGAVYKGLALAPRAQSKKGPMLYAANFHAGTIDVFDQNFNPVSTPGAFTDPNLPKGVAPFNIQALQGNLYVTYAKQDAHKHDDVAGPGRGFVDVYDNDGRLLRRLISRGDLNSPWGLVIAPNSFGAFGGDLLVGNFGDGKIHAYNPQTGAEHGTLLNPDGNPITINSLWALRFGNGVAGTPDSLLFTAGIGDEDHGLFGEINAQ
jgi:uncharacterized protein (TIGR03118 family)